MQSFLEFNLAWGRFLDMFGQAETARPVLAGAGAVRAPSWPLPSEGYQVKATWSYFLPLSYTPQVKATRFQDLCT